MISVLKSFLNVILLDRSTLKFAIGIVVGFGFSISVILSTVGIMDGFEWSLKVGLKKSMGDINVYSQQDYFNFEKDVLENLKVDSKKVTPILKTEGFVVNEGDSKGVIIKGVEQEAFTRISGLKLDFQNTEVAIGKELARILNLKVGDSLVLAFSSGNTEFNELPSLEDFKIGQIVEHGVYQKDLRFVYANRGMLQEVLNLKNKTNVFIMSSINPNNIVYHEDPAGYALDIEETIEAVESQLGTNYYARAFWEEFNFLLRAVATEKYMIGLILQLVVIISIFNILAFVIFVNEKRSREIFLFQALGMSQKKIFFNMIVLVIFSWILACLLSMGFVQIFDYSLANLSLFQLPGEVYTLGKVSIRLELIDYLVVFAIALLWLFLMAWFGLAKLRKKTVLQGLRREFA